jgi:hypothetical protein
MGLIDVDRMFDRTTKVVSGSHVATDGSYDLSQAVLHQVRVFARILILSTRWTRNELRYVLLRHVVNDFEERRAL